MDVMKSIEEGQLRSDLPEFGPGDTIRVMVKVREGEKERLQRFQGVVVQRRGAGLRASPCGRCPMVSASSESSRSTLPPSTAWRF